MESVSWAVRLRRDSAASWACSTRLTSGTCGLRSERREGECAAAFADGGDGAAGEAGGFFEAEAADQVIVGRFPNNGRSGVGLFFSFARGVTEFLPSENIVDTHVPGGGYRFGAFLADGVGESFEDD